MSVRNINAWYGLASTGQRAEGESWYADALSFVNSAHRDYRRYSRQQIAAATAAISPNCAWPDNRSAARIILAAHEGGQSPDSLRPAGVYPANIRKAYAILDGPAQPHVCDGTRIGASGKRVKCNGKSNGCYAPLHGPKVSEFYRTILGDTDGRVMDIWATRAADIHPSRLAGLTADDPRREGTPSGRIEALQAEYGRAADSMGIPAAEMQAVVWVVVRDHWIRADGRRNGARR